MAIASAARVRIASVVTVRIAIGTKAVAGVAIASVAMLSGATVSICSTHVVSGLPPSYGAALRARGVSTSPRVLILAHTRAHVTSLLVSPHTPTACPQRAHSVLASPQVQGVAREDRRSRHRRWNRQASPVSLARPDTVQIRPRSGTAPACPRRQAPTFEGPYRHMVLWLCDGAPCTFSALGLHCVMVPDS